MSEIKYATALKRAEEERRPIIEASQERLRVARESLPERTEELELANDAVDEIQGAWRSVTSSVDPDPATYATAIAAQTRAELRHQAAEREVDRARSGLRTLDLSASKVVAELAQKAYPSVSCHATFVDPRSVKPKASELPQIVVWSSEAPTVHDDGTVSGVLELVLYRDAMVHQMLDHKHIEDTAEALGLQMRVVGGNLANDSVNTSARGDGVQRDIVKVEIRKASPGDTPIIASIEDSPESVAHWLVRRLAEATAHGEPIRHHPTRGSYYLETSRITIAPHGAKVLSQDIDTKSGLRRTVVDTSVVIRTLPNERPGMPFDQVIERVLADCQSQVMFAGIGICDLAERVSRDDSDLFVPEVTLKAITDQLSPTDAKPRNSSDYEMAAEKLRRNQLVVRTSHLSKPAA